MPYKSVKIEKYNYWVKNSLTFKVYMQLFGEKHEYLGSVLFQTTTTSPKAKMAAHGGIVARFHADHFPWVIDMLRNEKPVYLDYTGDIPGEGFADFGTTPEPVGEEETNP